MKLWSIYLPRL